MPTTLNRLTETELAEAKVNLEKAQASLACEGLYLTAEQEARFHAFEAEALSHDERRRRIIEAHQPVRAVAAAE
jgi:hypothetical protein